MPALILIRGGGDLASGVALRLQRAGLQVLVSELPEPLAVRRKVSFAEAVYAGRITVEGVTGRLVEVSQVQAALEAGEIPVLVDPGATSLSEMHIPILIDGRLTKHPPGPLPVEVPLHIGLGPGFHAGRNCHAAIETRRGHTLGRVYWDGPTQPDSGQPEGDPRRVLRAPVAGTLRARKRIGAHCEAGELIAEILPERSSGRSGIAAETRDGGDGQGTGKITSPFRGVIRGLIHPGLQVPKGLKIGDVDPRDDPALCRLVSDKALAIGGGVIEALLTKPEIRGLLW